MYPEVELLSQMEVLSFFWETSVLFSVVPVPIYIPTNSVQFPFSHILANICLCCFVIYLFLLLFCYYLFVQHYILRAHYVWDILRVWEKQGEFKK